MPRHTIGVRRATGAAVESIIVGLAERKSLSDFRWVEISILVALELQFAHAPRSAPLCSPIWAAWPYHCREGAAVRSTQRYLILGLATAAAPIAIVVAAPQAGADCNYAAGDPDVRRHGPRCGRGAKGRDSLRPLSMRERLVLRHRLGSRLRYGIRISVQVFPGARRYRTTTMSNHPMTRQTHDEGANMLPSAPLRRAITAAIGTGALAGAMLFGAATVHWPSRPQFHRRARPPNWPA